MWLDGIDGHKEEVGYHKTLGEAIICWRPQGNEDEGDAQWIEE